MRIRRHAFTLIELLVVISIIAMLVAILLPSLGRARAAARKLQCASNIRQCITSVHAYAADHKNQLPDAGMIKPTPNQDYDETDIHMFQVGGADRSGRPTGMGLVYLNGYLPASEMMFCPSASEWGGSSFSTNWALWVARGYTDPTVLRNAISTNTQTSRGVSYCFRAQRWYGNNGIPSIAGYPALYNGGSILRFDQYLYSFDAGMLSKYPQAALLSDSFIQGTSVLGSSFTENAINFHHMDGVNVLYADGHGEWLADRNKHIAGLTATAGVGHNIGSMTDRAEDVWDAFDGLGLFTPTYSFVASLK